MKLEQPSLKEALQDINYKIKCEKEESIVYTHHENVEKPVPCKKDITHYIITDIDTDITIASIKEDVVKNLEDCDKKAESYSLHILNYGNVSPFSDLVFPEIFKETTNLYLEQNQKPIQEYTPLQPKNFHELLSRQDVYEIYKFIYRTIKKYKEQPSLEKALEKVNYKIECKKDKSLGETYYKNATKPVPSKLYRTRCIITDIDKDIIIASIEKEFFMNLEDCSKKDKSYGLYVHDYGFVSPFSDLVLPYIFKATANLYLKQNQKPIQKYPPLQPKTKEEYLTQLEIRNIYDKISEVIEKLR